VTPKPQVTTATIKTTIKTTTNTLKQIITTKKIETRPTTTVPKTNVVNYMPPCMHEYDAIIAGKIYTIFINKFKMFYLKKDTNQNIYVIVDGDDLWAFNLSKKAWEKKNLYEKYPGLEENVRGGVTCKHNHTWFFKSK
jgi:hypothetical protein